MATPSDLLAQYLEPVAPAQTPVVDGYQLAAGGMSDRGVQTMSGAEQDLRTMDDYQLLAKYGAEGAAALRQQAALGGARYDQDTAVQQPLGAEALGDTLTNVGGGFARSLAGLANLGVGAISDEAGAWGADKIDDFTEWTRSLESNALQRRRAASESRASLVQRDDAATYQREKATEGEFVAGLKRIGREALHGVTGALDDSVVAGAGTADALGSLLAAGPISKGAKAAGAGISALAPSRATALLGEATAGLSQANRARVASAASQIPTMAAITGMEAGGVYQQTMSEVMGMSHEQLLRGSQSYVDYINQGMSADEARQAVAGDAAMQAAGQQALVAAPTSALVSRFEGAPLRGLGSPAGLAGTVLKEAVEEGVQSGGSQIATNMAIAANADAQRDLTEGVGGQVGQGALYGSLATGVVQGPQVTAQTIGAAAGLTLDAVGKRAATIRERVAAGSPVSDTAMDQQIADLADAAALVRAEAAVPAEDGQPAPALTPEDDHIVNTLLPLVQANGADMIQEGMSPALVEVLSQSNGMHRVVKNLAERLDNPVEGDDVVDLAEFLSAMTSGTMEQVNAFSAQAEAMDPESKGYRIYSGLKAAVEAAESSPAFRKAMNLATENLAAEQDSLPLDIVPGTPEGDRAVRAVVTLANMAPEKVDAQRAGIILQQAQDGRIELSPEQVSTLRATVSLVQAEQAAARQLADAGVELSSGQTVTGHILTDEFAPGDTRARSMVGHARTIMQAMSRGDVAEAANQLGHMAGFAQSQNNKVEALNTALAEGKTTGEDTVPYQAWTWKGDWKQAPEGMFLNPKSVGSLSNAQRIAADTRALTAVYNGLATAYPELGFAPLSYVQLAEGISGSTAAVAAAYKAQSAPQQIRRAPMRQEAPAVAEERPAAPVEKAPAKVEAPIEPAPVAESAPAPVAETVVEETPAVAEPAPVEAEPTPAAFDEMPPKAVAAMGDAKPALKKMLPTLRPGSAFTRAFNKSNNASRVAGVRNAIEQVQSWADEMELPADVSAQYRDVLSFGSQLVERINSNVGEFLAQPAKFKAAKGKTNAQALVENWDSISLTANLRLGHLMDVVDGAPSLNQALLEGAVLAGLNWMINSDRQPVERSGSDLVKDLGLADEGVVLLSAEAVNQLNSAGHYNSAVEALASMIQRYWGVAGDSAVADGMSVGTAQAMAIEVLAAMEQMGAVTVTTVSIGSGGDVITSGKPVSVQKLLTVEPIQGEEEGTKGVIYSAPDVIEELLMEEPVRRYAFDAASLKPAQARHNQADVANTPEQMEALDRAQKVDYKPNLPLFGFIRAMGRDAAMRLFGEGDLTGDLYNKAHLKTLEGRNRGIERALDEVDNITAAMITEANKQGINQEDVANHYRFNMTSVGRMQMFGDSNPQSSKVMRALMLPTWSTMDMNTEAGLDAWNLAMGQALGVKVHTQSQAATDAAVEALLDGALAPAMSVLADWVEVNGDVQLDTNTTPLTVEETKIIEDAFVAARIGDAPWALFALMEQARLDRLAPADRAQFRTPLYAEADGVTNGPVNALMMLRGTGKVTAQWVANALKGGMSFGRTLTMQDIRKIDPVDLYKTSAVKLEAAVMEALGNSSEENVALANSLLDMMNLLYGGNIRMDDGVLTVDRGVTKNPLTITLYGSGAAGIASNLVGEMLEDLYSRLTQAARASVDEADQTAGWIAAFDGDESAANRFLDALVHLTQNVVGKDGVGPSGVRVRNGIDFSTFEIREDEFKALQQNVQNLFVAPLQEAITETVGDTVMQGMGAIQSMTQAQSLVAQELFKQKVQAAIEAKKAAGDYAASLFLSKDEQDAIIAEIRDVVPAIEVSGQTFSFMSKEKTTFAGSSLGAGMTTGESIQTRVLGPADVGVGGIPGMIIGSGDGHMILHATLEGDGLSRSLPVFDGVNLPLDLLKSHSVRLNRAVQGSWNNNPVGDVLASFETTAQFLLDNPGVLPDAVEEAVLMALTMKGGKPAKSIADAVGLWRTFGGAVAELTDIQHKVMSSVNGSVDQMATAFSPYVRKGTEQIADNLTNEEIAEELEGRVKTLALQSDNLLVKDEGEMSSAAQIQMAATEAPALTGKVLPGGAMELDTQALLDLSRGKDLNQTQKEIVREILRSRALDGWRVLIGTPEQLAKASASAGQALTAKANRTVHGAVDTGTKTVFLPSLTAETLTHELTHAATINAVVGSLNGSITDQAIMAATTQLGNLTKEFVESEYHGLDPEMMVSIAHAKASIQDALEGDGGVAVNLASAINEFMAWTMANPRLQELLAKRKAPSSLVQLSQRAIAAIKKLLWGRTKAPAYADDFLGQAKFWTSVVIRSAPSAVNGDGESNTTLRHSTTNSANNRLTEVTRTFGSLMRAYEASPVRLGKADPANNVPLAVAQAVKIRKAAAAAGFQFNPQETDAFFMMASALSSDAIIDPQVMLEVGKLHRHVMKHLRADMFDAPAKYDFLTNGLADQAIFAGLAVANEEFRTVLRQLPAMPGAAKGAGSLDSHLAAVGENSMRRLQTKLAGSTGKEPTVVAAMDNMMSHLAAQLESGDAFLDRALAGPEGLLAVAEKRVTDMFEEVGDRAMTRREKVLANANASSMQEFVANLGVVASGLVSEAGAEATAEGVLGMTNRENVLAPFRRLMSDLVGRTSSNAALYDMIKTVRTGVQQMRNRHREDLPKIFEKQFKKKPDAKQWKSMLDVMGRTDLTSLRSWMTRNAVLDMLGDDAKVASRVGMLENTVRSLEPRNSALKLILDKSKQLGRFMATGEAGTNLLRNAEAIAFLLNTKQQRNTLDPVMVETIDQLVSLYALQATPAETLQSYREVLADEKDGLGFLLDYMDVQRKDEMAKVRTSVVARLNHFKGYMPNQPKQGVSLIVAADNEYQALSTRGYQRVAAYTGSSADPSKIGRSYYFSATDGYAPFHQGIMQNTQHTGFGTLLHSGTSLSHLNAGRITDPKAVAAITHKIETKGETGAQRLMPVFDEDGDIVAYERSLDRSQQELLGHTDHLAHSMANWQGRLLEETMATEVNAVLVRNLHNMWEQAKKDGKRDQYIDIRSREATKDPVVNDALNLMTREMRNELDATFGRNAPVYVRRDMLEDVIGYRAASVTDVWTGTSHWSKGTREIVDDIVTATFGAKAFQRLVMAERVLQGAIADARVIIAVKSIVVPVVNLISNVLHLISRGVPIMEISRQMPRKLNEIHSYVEMEHRKVELEAQLRASRKPETIKRLQTELDSINESQSHLTIYPLIQGGEFSAISDLGVTMEDLEITQGKLSDYIEKKIDLLPKGVRALAHNLMVSKSTALYHGLQKSVHYGDFLAKAVLYDNLTNKKQRTNAEALGQITEEFVNYDRLPGRFRGSLESYGLLWFYNFKIRSTKVAASTIRRNPLHTLLATMIPLPDVFGSVGLPVQDNLLSKMVEGSLDNSMGFDQGLRAPALNPWWNLVN